MALKVLQPCCCGIAGPWDVYAEVEAGGTNLITRTATWHPYVPPPYDSSPNVDLEDEWEWAIEIPDARQGHMFQSKAQESSLAPFGSAEKVYLGMQNSDAMRSREPVYDFEDSMEGFSGSGSALITLSHDTNHGAPGSSEGCMAFTITDPDAKNGARTKYASHTNQTWEDYGVPSGSLVGEVEFVQLYRKVHKLTNKLTSHSFALVMVDDNGDPVLDAALFATALPTETDTYWRRVANETLNERINVVEPSRPSDSPANLQLIYYAVLNDNEGDPDEMMLFDDIEIWIYYSYSNQHGNAKINVAKKSLMWIITDSSWESYAWRHTQSTNSDLPFYSATPGKCYPISAMGIAQDTAFNPGEGDPFGIHYYGYDGNWIGADATSIVQWSWPDTSEFYYWKIDDVGESAGAKTYREYYPAIYWAFDITQNYPPETPALYGYPRYTYLDTEPGYYATPESLAHIERLNYKSWAMPIGHLSQANKAIGVWYPHIEASPLYYDDYRRMAGANYTASVNVVIGSLVFHDVIVGHCLPSVSGTNALHMAVEALYCGVEITSTYDPEADADYADWTERWHGYMKPALILRVTHADAGKSSTTCTAEIIYHDDYRYTFVHAYFAEGGEDLTKVIGKEWYANRTKHCCILQIGDHQEEYILSSHLEDEASNQTFDPIYPKWIEVRALQRSGASTVLEVVPKHQSEADSRFDGDTSQVAMRLRYFAGSTEQFTFETPIKYTIQASGETTLDTENSATIILTVVRGGVVDGQAAVSLDITINQVIGDAYERAVYNALTGSLDCHLDIAAGHNTVAHLVAVIAHAGDFDCVASSSSTDIIEDGTAVDSCELVGGSTIMEGYSGSPIVWDSSNDFFYISGFPMRVMHDFPTDIIGRRAWRMCSQGEDFITYPTAWAISHDGTITNPTGIGVEACVRPGPTPESRMGYRSWNTVKNTVAATLCPPLEFWGGDDVEAMLLEDGSPFMAEGDEVLELN